MLLTAPLAVEVGELDVPIFLTSTTHKKLPATLLTYNYISRMDGSPLWFTLICSVIELERSLSKIPLVPHTVVCCVHGRLTCGDVDGRCGGSS